MTAEIDKPGADDARNAEVLAAFAEAFERDGDASIAVYASKHPSLKTEIEATAEALRVLLSASVQMKPPPDVPPSLPPRIGRLQVIRELGHGGMGIVYLANDPTLGRDVAVKILPTPAATIPVALERFRREVRAVAQVRHPNIVAVHEVGTWENAPYFAMEFIDGAGLDVILGRLTARASEPLKSTDLLPDPTRATTAADGRSSRGGSFVEAAVRMIVRLADALDHAHRAGVVHRDVKPGNVLIDQDGEPHLADVGLALNSDEAALTKTGGTPGTPAYMAPERFKSGSDGIGPPTDVYGLGITLYQCLTLRLPFAGDSVAEVYRNIESGEPIRPRTLNPRISADLETIVMKAIERDVKRRYATAAAFRDDLQALLELRPISARPTGFITRSIRQVRRSPIHAAAAALAGLIVLIGLATVAFSFARQSAGEQQWQEYRNKRAELEALPESLAKDEATLNSDFIEPEWRGEIYEVLRERDRLRTDCESLLIRAEQSFADAERWRAWLGPLNHSLWRRRLEIRKGLAALADERHDVIELERRRRDVREFEGATAHPLTEVRLGVSPAHCDVHLFRYDEYTDLRPKAIPRLVPVPVDPDSGEPSLDRLKTIDFGPGDLCIVVTDVKPDSFAESSGVTRGDLILEIDGRRTIDGVFVRDVVAGGRADAAGATPFDRVVKFQGAPVRDLFDWEARLLESFVPDKTATKL